MAPWGKLHPQNEPSLTDAGAAAIDRGRRLGRRGFARGPGGARSSRPFDVANGAGVDRASGAGGACGG